ncbi:MAG: ABC transporter ATP-binding protein [Erysipelotrichaceae bacterium]|nr:ABC transporter ATP-binding protein [Erysipelotrichaceae bacterium]
MKKAIVTKNITKKYKNIIALNGVSISINEGELYGLLGVNGAGKTTLIKILTGLSKCDGGEASVLGMDLSQIDEIKKVIDISPQETSIALNLTVKENLIFFANLYDMEDKEYLNRIIHSFGLLEVINRKAKTLSGGWKRRLSIAIGLISKPKILFLDEPTLGLDVISRRELWRIIASLKGKMTLILITSHYLEEIETLCDRVALMSKGNVLEEGTIEEIKQKANETSFEEAFVKIVGGNSNEEDFII